MGVNVKVNLTRPFSDAVGAREVTVPMEDGTVEDVLAILVAEHPSLGGMLYEEAGELTDYVVVFVNDRPVTALEGMSTALRDGDELTVLMPISGG